MATKRVTTEKPKSPKQRKRRTTMETPTPVVRTFADFIQAERERLAGERTATTVQARQLTNRLNQIDRELTAIRAYESVKAGKRASVALLPPPRRSPAQVEARHGRGSKREAILAVVRDVPDGLKRAGIIEKMGLKGNKSGEMSVSNALTALTKTNQLARVDGKYVVLSA